MLEPPHPPPAVCSAPLTSGLASEMQVEVRLLASNSRCFHRHSFSLCHTPGACHPQTLDWALFWFSSGFSCPQSPSSTTQSLYPGLQNPFPKQPRACVPASSWTCIPTCSPSCWYRQLQSYTPTPIPYRGSLHGPGWVG